MKMKCAVLIATAMMRSLNSWGFQVSFATKNTLASVQQLATARGHANRNLKPLKVEKQPYASQVESVHADPLDDNALETKLNDAGFHKLGESVYKALLLNHTYSWATSLGPSMWHDKRGMDITVEWSDNVSRAFAVESLLGHKNDIETIEISECMRCFECFCQLAGIEGKRYTARLVATRGSAGTKCPQWHVDHAHVRWIQALLGPGCMWIEGGEDDIHWDRINGLELQYGNVEDRNKLIVPDASKAKIGRSGEPLLLIGNKWEGSTKPALHKSPSNLLPWQKRVLLTMDVHC